MNETRSHLNEMNLKDMRGLKELKVTIYTNNVYIPFQWLNYKTLMLSVLNLEEFMFGDLKIFLGCL